MKKKRQVKCSKLSPVKRTEAPRNRKRKRRAGNFKQIRRKADTPPWPNSRSSRRRRKKVVEEELHKNFAKKWRKYEKK
jgi:hypothetical protein